MTTLHVAPDPSAARIAKLNDELRVRAAGGQTFVTPSITERGPDFVGRALAAMRAFDDFTDDNDPWQEHDCATFTVDGETLLFKVDYYDLNEEYHSSDPSDPRVTRRVLTLCFAHER